MEVKQENYHVLRGDNFTFMKKLESESINLIYCDILYGTGRNFIDYQDIKANKQLIEGHYIPRLKEMYRLLSKDGTILLQCDNKINHWIRLMLDEIFGYDNFRNEIIWNYGGQSKKTDISNKHDVIIRYTKSKKYTYNTQYKPHTERSKKEYRHLYNGKKCARTCRRDKDGNKVYYYSPLNELGTNITSVWDDIGYLTPSSKERKDVKYQTQKPLKLLERIVSSFSNVGDTVGDFYMGSGTTAIASIKLHRKFVGCDIGRKAFDITLNRINKNKEGLQ